MQMTPFILRLTAVTLLLVASGCASMRRSVPRPVSTAWERPQDTALGRHFASAQAAQPGRSGFLIVENNYEALVSRMALADAAEKTLDCQYYIYDPDESGSEVTRRLVAAADRGVRVRLLLDDFKLSSDLAAAGLDSHSNIEVRVFNPYRYRTRALRWLQYPLDVRRTVCRMHNKIFSVDGEVAILGGRNISDNYFDLHRESNFRDFDILCVGRAVSEADRIFDLYWNSSYTLPASALVRKSAATAAGRRILGELQEAARLHRDTVEQCTAAAAKWMGDFLSGATPLVWARAEVIWEPPEKIDGASMRTALVVQRLYREILSATNEVLAESGYFIPGNDGVAALSLLCRNGVNVRVVTTALEATDEPLVYSMYRNYRLALLRAGVDLFEFRLHAAPNGHSRRWFRPRSTRSALHAKAIVFDRNRCWIGSSNLDPRSYELNTEIAVLIHSPELSRQLADYIVEDMQPDRSWHVGTEESPGGLLFKMAWSGMKKGQPVVLHREPATSWWQRFRAWFYGRIPGLERML